MKHNYREIEPKWQKIWDEKRAFEAKNDFTKPKYYALVEFPYPSGQGLHIGASAPVYGDGYCCPEKTYAGI